MMNLADPELELIDPTPNVHSMFLHFDKTFFWEKLSSRCVVRWSKRMYSCAGICSYEGRGGLCDIALSEPLLKLRPRKDLVETLLHEMIHAFLFITRKDQDRDGHGPNFQAHMHRINRAAGLNISIYHDFHDEVKMYQTHWWRCDGPCHKIRPHFGIVRRTCNRAPGPYDYWWNAHKRNCGGTFIKIKEPEKLVKESKGKKTKVAKPNEDITKYINNNNNNDFNNKNNVLKDKPNKPVLKDTSNIPIKSNVGVKSNSSSTLVVTKKNVVFNPQLPPQKPNPSIFSGTGQPLNGERKRTSSANVLETVRSVWANKQLGVNNKKEAPKNTTMNSNKHKADTEIKSPPQKVKKIDDYFKSTANSLLKGLYGQDLIVTQSKTNEKFIAVSSESKKINIDIVSCPVCNKKIKSSEINGHLDECLNKSVIDDICNEKQTKEKAFTVNDCSKNNKKTKETLDSCNLLSSNNTVADVVKQDPDYTIDLSDIKYVNEVNRKRSRASLDQSDLIKPEAKKFNPKLRKSDSFTDTDRLSAVRNEIVARNTSPVIVESPIKAEPGCSKTNGKVEPECPCCGDKLNTTVDEHLEECLSFFDSNTSIPEEGASTSFSNETIVIDDEDEFDETLTMNSTGTKLPCPCCLTMVEEIDMNKHLDICLS